MKRIKNAKWGKNNQCTDTPPLQFFIYRYKRARENDTWWFRIYHSSWQRKESHLCCYGPLFRTGNGKFWNIHRTHRIWIHAITISSSKWKEYCERLSTTDMSPCDYYRFAKVKEPLLGTRYNTRGELIRTIRRSIRNMNRNGRADGV